MLRRNCLLNNAPLIGNLVVLMRQTAADLQAQKLKPTFGRLYNALREQGIEIDLQTAGDLYKTSFNTNNTDVYSSVQQIDKATGRTLNKLITATLKGVQKKEIKGDSPVVAAVDALFNRILPRVGSDPSVQKIMQDRLVKWATNQLQIRNQPITKKTSQEIFQEALLLHFNQPFGASSANQSPSWVGVMGNALEAQNDLKQVFDIVAQAAGTPYQQAQIQTIANQLSRIPYSLMLSISEVKTGITDLMVSAGFGRTINRQGTPTQVIDWEEIFKRGPDFRAVADQALTGMGFNPTEIALITDALEHEYEIIREERRLNRLQQKHLQATEIRDPIIRNDLDRLFELYDLGIFQAAQQDALNRVLGVSSMDREAIDALMEILRISKMAYQTPGAEWSPTFSKLIRRSIERQITRMENRSSALLSFVRNWSYYSQLSSGFIIANYQNSLVQNVVSAVGEIMVALVRNPQNGLQAIEAFGEAFADVFLGGVRIGEDKSQVFDVTGNVEDLFNLSTRETAGRSFKDILYSLFSQILRTALSTMDAGAKAALLQLHTSDLLTKAIERSANQSGQQVTRGEAALIANEVMFGSNPDLESLADAMVATTQGIRETGRPQSGFTRARILRELAIQNTLSGGSTLTTAVQNLIAEGKLAPAFGTGSFSGLPEKEVRSIVASANHHAARGLGHISEYSVMRNTLDRMHNWVGELLANVRKDKTLSPQQKRTKLAAAELARSTYTALFRFFGGSMRWAVLTAVKGTFIPAAAETLYRAGRSGLYAWNPIRFDNYREGSLHELFFENVEYDPDNEKQTTEAFNRYLTIRQRLVRGWVGATVSYIVGYQIILPWLMEKFLNESPGDDEDKQKAMWSKLSDEISKNPGLKRWIRMGVPVAVWTFLQEQRYGRYLSKARAEGTIPQFSDFFDPAFGAMNFVGTYNPPQMTKLFMDLQKEQEKQKPDYAKIVADALFNILNLGGFATMLDINRKATAALRGEDTDMTAFQRESAKPDGEIFDDAWTFLEHTMYYNLSRERFAKLYGKDNRIAPVHDWVIKLWRDLGKIDILPPLAEAELSLEGFQFNFDRQLADEYIQLRNGMYMKWTSPENGVGLAALEGIREGMVPDVLQEIYEAAKEEADALWLERYPISPESPYWQLTPAVKKEIEALESPELQTDSVPQ